MQGISTRSLLALVIFMGLIVVGLYWSVVVLDPPYGFFVLVAALVLIVAIVVRFRRELWNTQLPYLVAIAVPLALWLSYIRGGLRQPSYDIFLHQRDRADMVMSGLAIGLFSLILFPSAWVVATNALRTLREPVASAIAAFIGVYTAVVVLFAFLYATVYIKQGKLAFSGLPDSPRLLDFVYFSGVTAATVGYGDITPRDTTARMLSVVESATTILLVAVYLGVVLGRLRSRKEGPERKADR